jgi:hypothetical protein
MLNSEDLLKNTRYEIRAEINIEHPMLIEECRSGKMYQVQITK